MNEKSSKNYVIGLDFGTDSVRSLLVDCENGKDISHAVVYYPRWQQGLFCDPDRNQFRHHPLDYLESMEKSLKNCLAQVDDEIKSNIVGISADTTGSTPALVDQEGNVLAQLSEFKRNPNGMFVLWKDHTSVEETEEINQKCKGWGGEDYTKYEGGVYSSEWWWSKILHILRTDEDIRENAFSAIELCDWIPSVLTGIKNPSDIKRSRCAAGHKAMWNESWGGLPPEKFIEVLDPVLTPLRSNMYSQTFTSDQIFGILSEEWTTKLGLKKDIKVGVGAFDAHMGAVGAGISEGSLVKIMGTSTCDVMVADKKILGESRIKGICGQVDGSVIPGMVGLEAGQSSFGDVYAWFKNLLAWPLEHFLENHEKTEVILNQIIPKLAKEAEKTRIDENLIALDWLNGRRTPNADQSLKAAMRGLSLGTNAPKVFRTLAEATAYGARAINECFEDQGISIREIIGIGGVAQKSDFVMQVLSDVLNRTIKISDSDQTCALGAAMFASTVAGVYHNVQDAQNAMNPGFSKIYRPNPENVKIYDELYQKYLKLAHFIEETNN